MLKILWGLLVISLSFGTANANKLSNVVTVASIETACLVAVFCIGSILSLIVVIRSKQAHSSSELYDETFVMTSNTRTTDSTHKSGDHITIISGINIVITDWVSAMQSAVEVLTDFRHCDCDVTADIIAVQDAITSLSSYQHRLAVRQTDNDIYASQQHRCVIVLSKIADDVLGNLSYTYTSRSTTCFRSNKKWDQT